ncbi:transforming growth factor-beta receptor-associated protein 1 [Denticeps clupeoides]|uniref:CNH domain-containing protein n=1 Tax=Denticeps clupeoides TaxID=299321 RepID=A0AAY4AP75_9TELE|nr:transforming growth factor-beta receptor-associated protein 1-like [Denticeps clupeoides]
MSCQAFSSVVVFEKPGAAKGADKVAIQCLEWCCKNFYVGWKDGVVQRLAPPSKRGGNGEAPRIVEANRRQMGKSGPVARLKAVPLLNHLLVLWDSSLTVLNMFSLERVSALRRVENVSLFEVGDARDASVEVFTASARRRAVSVCRLSVGTWECVTRLSLQQDPVALAVTEACLCVATVDRYVLHQYESGDALCLFQHNLSKQRIIAKKAGRGEFLLNGPGSLGMFVTNDGTSRRPPVQWPEGVLDAAVHFPYVLTLQSQAVHVYSMVDQKLKQVISVSRAAELLSTPDHVFIVTEKEIHRLSPRPLEDQIRALAQRERTDEALLLLDGVQALLPEDLYNDLHKNITSMSGMQHFYLERFYEAKRLFIEADLDPRELLSLYPEASIISGHFTSELPAVSTCRDFQKLREEDDAAYRRYLSFLGDFLWTVRGTDQTSGLERDVDSALLRIYLQLEESDQLIRFVSSPNHCRLEQCAEHLKQHGSFFALGLLYQSHGQQSNAIQTWIDIVEDEYDNGSSSDVYQHILNCLARLEDRDTFWTFAGWALQRNQEAGVQIFTQKDKEGFKIPGEIVGFLAKYPLALMLYLEFLVGDMSSTEEKHHTLLAATYVTAVLQTAPGEAGGSAGKQIRWRLQELLWRSPYYNVHAVHEKVMHTDLQKEKAILLGKLGRHGEALQILVHEEKDGQAAEEYCRRTSAGQKRKCRQAIFHTLLQIHLDSGAVGAAADLLERSGPCFDAAGVLRLLPASWSLQLVSRFLRAALRGALHDRRMREVEVGLASLEHLRYRSTWMKTAARMIKVGRGEVCQVCQHLLRSSEFACTTDGQLTHTGCTQSLQDSSQM